MMKFYQEFLKTYVGPAIVAGVVIGGYYAYNTIQQQKVVIDNLLGVLNGQCQVMLEQQGFGVTEPVVEESTEEK